MNELLFEETMMSFNIPLQKNIDLKKYTTLQLGGPARFLVEIESEEELLSVIAAAKDAELPYMVLGNGSNILFTDDGYPGLIIVLSRRFCQIKRMDNTLCCQAGASLKATCEVALHYGLTGMEFAYGIPGSVGGALYMNAGAYGGEMKDIIKAATYLDDLGDIQQITFMKQDFSYRHSFFTNTSFIILEVMFELQPGDPIPIRNRMEQLMEKRRSKQPLEYPSAGSVFKRPEGAYASMLIEQCGLKGVQVGGSMVSKKHAGFLINYNHANSKDFLALIQKVQHTVFQKTGYLLECEIKIIKE